MTRALGHRPHPADASVLLSVRGVPSWAAIVVAAVFCVAGAMVDGDPLGILFAVIAIAGVALAALAVRRGSIFTGMVQAPIVLTIVEFVTAFASATGVSTKENVASGLIGVVHHFPTMAVATGVGLLLGLVRIVAQPSRRDTAYRGPARSGARASHL